MSPDKMCVGGMHSWYVSDYCHSFRFLVSDAIGAFGNSYFEFLASKDRNGSLKQPKMLFDEDNSQPTFFPRHP